MKNEMSKIPGLAVRSTAWNSWSQGRLLALLATGLLAVPTTAFSATVVMDFEGGLTTPPTLASPAVAVGTYQGVTFSTNGRALLYTGLVGGGTWNQDPLTSGNESDVILFSSNGSSIFLDYAAGFNSFSLSYSTLANSFVKVWATGALTPFDTFILDVTSNPPGTVWTTYSEAFLQTATRLELGGGGVAGRTGYDDITLNPAPVPLPAAAWLLLSGLVGLGFFGRRRATVN